MHTTSYNIAIIDGRNRIVAVYAYYKL